MKVEIIVCTREHSINSVHQGTLSAFFHPREMDSYINRCTTPPPFVFSPTEASTVTNRPERATLIPSRKDLNGELTGSAQSDFKIISWSPCVRPRERESLLAQLKATSATIVRVPPCSRPRAEQASSCLPDVVGRQRHTLTVARVALLIELAKTTIHLL